MSVFEVSRGWNVYLPKEMSEMAGYQVFNVGQDGLGEGAMHCGALEVAAA